MQLPIKSAGQRKKTKRLRPEFVVFDGSKHVIGIIKAYSSPQAITAMRITRGTSVGDQGYALPRSSFPNDRIITIGQHEDELHGINFGRLSGARP